LIKSLKKSLHLLALQCGLAKCTAHSGTKLLKLQPYKATVVHSLLPPNDEARIQFCGSFRDLVSNGLLCLEFMFYSVKVWFILSGHVNRTTGAGAQNHHAVYEVPLHSLKLGVLCAISAWRIIRPIFLFMEQ
jgi:hypothetical protein